MTPVGVFFICQNEDKCHFVNSTIFRRRNTLKNSWVSYILKAS